MTNRYKYSEPEAASTFSVLPPGEYNFQILNVESPYTKDNGNIVLTVKLNVDKNTHVYDRPWCGKDKNDKFTDKIAQLLKAVNRAPAVGQEPDWRKLVGAKGRVVVKVGSWEGRERNEVDHYVFALDIKQSTQPSGPVDTDNAPDDIPF